MEQLLLAKKAPAAVLVDENLEVLQFRGETAAYLEHTSYEATLNLLQLTRSGLDAELRKLVARAAQRSARRAALRARTAMTGHDPLGSRRRDVGQRRPAPVSAGCVCSTPAISPVPSRTS